MSDTFTGSTKSTRSRYHIAEAFSDYFPVAEFSHYDAFLTVPGDSLKRERRTLITLIQRPLRCSPAEEVSSFVLKVYKYPFFPRLRTGFQISKAEREFDSLRYLNEIGLDAAQAVGYGV